VKGTWTKDVGLLLLRLSGLGLAAAHGWPKISMFLAGEGGRFIEGVERMGFPLPIVFAWAAGLSELVGGVALAFGFATRIAASFAAATVFTAAFFRHHLLHRILIFFGLMSAPQEVVESWGNPERAALYFLILLSLIAMGGGRLSLDRLLLRSRR
jgi:putative oxidoreductase